MSWPHSKSWLVFLAAREAHAFPPGEEPIASNDPRALHAGGESALDVWAALERVLPPRSVLTVLLASDLASVQLIQGADTLAEQDWHALASKQMAEETIAYQSPVLKLDSAWLRGPRFAVVTEATLLQRIAVSACQVRSIQVYALRMLCGALVKRHNQPLLAAIVDPGSWTLAAAADSRWSMLLRYPPLATREQVAAEARRTSLAQGLPHDVKFELQEIWPPAAATLLESGLPKIEIDFAASRHVLGWAALLLSLIILCAVVAMLLGSQKTVARQAQVLEQKVHLRDQLATAVEARARAVSAAQKGQIQRSPELSYNWTKVFAELEKLAAENTGVSVVNFSHRATENNAQITVWVPKTNANVLLPRFIKSATEEGWRITSIKPSQAGAEGATIEIQLVKEQPTSLQQSLDQPQN